MPSFEIRYKSLPYNMSIFIDFFFINQRGYCTQKDPNVERLDYVIYRFAQT